MEVRQWPTVEGPPESMRRAFRLTIELVSSLIQRENIEVVVRPRRYGAEIEARWTPQRRR